MQKPYLDIAKPTIQFSGYSWQVKHGDELGPGPNHWDSSNVWVDNAGSLHMRVTKHNGRWTCAEVRMTERLGYGTFQFHVKGRVDLFDRNIVLGLFNYTLPDVGPDGTNEIDIECSQFGEKGAYHGSWAVCASVEGHEPWTQKFPIKLEDTDETIHRFVWSETGVKFVALYGNSERIIASADFRPADFQRRIPQKPLPVHINLWLFRGRPPTDDESVEVVIKGFCHSLEGVGT